MKPVLTSKEMRSLDRDTTASLRILPKELMSLAGKSCFDDLTKRFGSVSGKSFLIFCGKGNNGGDGFALARWLLNHGGSVDIILLFAEQELSKDALDSLKILFRYVGYVHSLRIIEASTNLPDFILQTSYNFIIDCIFGTGFTLREITGLIKESINFINTSKGNAEVVSIDSPTGLDSTTGEVGSTFVKADATISLGFLKTGLLCNKDVTGEISIADISIPSFLVPKDSWKLINSNFAKKTLPTRLKNSHKGTNGKVLIIGGSQIPDSSMIGASILAAKASLSVGAGYVCLAVPSTAFNTIHSNIPECIICSQSTHAIKEKLDWADVILIGCGLGRSYDEIQAIINLVLSKTDKKKKIILDADALNTISEKKMLYKLDLPNILITPHLKEFYKLFPEKAASKDRLASAKDLVKEHKFNILLKGSPTAICGNDHFYLSDSGTEALATAGTGDILSGMIAGLASQKNSLVESAACGAYLHGIAGQQAKSSTFFYPKTTDIMKEIKQLYL